MPRRSPRRSRAPASMPSGSRGTTRAPTGARALPTLIRSTWNYAQQPAAFAVWLDRVAAVAPVWNPPAIVRWNVRKRYLLELAARGVATAPRRRSSNAARAAGADLRAASGGGRFVIKPEVGAGSWLTRAFERADDPAAEPFLREVTARGAALVQPYVASVDGYGERSLVWIDGELSHAIRKSPRFSGDRESTTGPFPIADAERALADAALAPVREKILYGRVDLARDADGRPMIMELELVEPSLFFARGGAAWARRIALRRRARRAAMLRGVAARARSRRRSRRSPRGRSTSRPAPP